MDKLLHKDPFDVCAGDSLEVGLGDDLRLLTEREPGRLWRDGQHAHHLQHQQQVWNRTKIAS